MVHTSRRHERTLGMTNVIVMLPCRLRMLTWLSAFCAAAGVAGCQWYSYAPRDGGDTTPTSSSFDVRLSAAFAALDARAIAATAAITHAGGPIRLKEAGPVVRDGIAPERALVDIGRQSSLNALLLRRRHEHPRRAAVRAARRVKCSASLAELKQQIPGIRTQR